MLHKPDERNMQESMKATHHEQIEAVYCQIKLAYKRKNRGLGVGYNNTMNWIEYQEIN